MDPWKLRVVWLANWLALSSISPLCLMSQVSLPNTVLAHETSSPISMDGRLDEPAWQEAVKIHNFTQRELNFGEPVTEQTAVALLYDAQNLYVGVWCYDRNPEQIIARELKRDFDYDLEDNFILVLDTYGDERNGFMFVVNPAGARADLQLFNNGGSTNAFWNGVWDTRARITPQGWFAEIVIPFNTLRYRGTQALQNWGVNFERNIRRKREQARWQGWSRDNDITQVNQAGKITQLSPPDNKQFVEIKPYVLGGREYSGNPKNLWNLGGDVNYLLNSAWRLSLTVNTDFAQVEADQQQVNITRFPLFFPELREFFLEGENYFDMGFGGNRIIPFYTRRIGLNEERETVPIIAGGRLLGKEKNSTVGLMSIQTAAQGEQPGEQFTVGSWRQDVGAQSIVGLMSANKFSDGRWHTTTGVNGRYSIANLFGSKNLNMGGAVIKSHNTDDGWQSRSYAYRFFLQYPNDRFNIFASTQRSPAPFDAEIGLMRRRNFRENFLLAGFNPRPNGKWQWIRQFDLRPVMLTYTQYDDTKELQTFEYGIRLLGLDTRSGEQLNVDYEIRAEGLIQDFALATEVTIPKGEYWWRQWSMGFSTFAGRPLSFSTQWRFGGFYNGEAISSVNNLQWRMNKHFNFSLRYEKNQIRLPYGTVNTDLIGNRIEYAINPNIFGSLLSQWNSVSDELNFNFRLQIIPMVGADFFLIVNQIYDAENGDFEVERGTVLGKLIWRFVL